MTFMPDDLRDIAAEMLRHSIVHVDAGGTTISVSAGPLHVDIDAVHVHVEAGNWHYEYPVPYRLAAVRDTILADARNLRDIPPPPRRAHRAHDIARFQQRMDDARERARKMDAKKSDTSRNWAPGPLPSVGTWYRRRGVSDAYLVRVERVYRVDETMEWFVDAIGNISLCRMPVADFNAAYELWRIGDASPGTDDRRDGSVGAALQPREPTDPDLAEHLSACEPDLPDPKELDTPEPASIPPPEYDPPDDVRSFLHSLREELYDRMPLYDLADLLIVLARGDL